MDGARHIAFDIGNHVMLWLAVFAVLTTLELFLPRERQSIGARVQGLLFWIVWIPVTDLVLRALGGLWAMLGVTPLVTLPLAFTGWGMLAAILSPIAGAIVGDFFFYWMHRAQHRWFWRYHAVHHSIRELSAINCYHHISEPIVTTAIVIVPTSLIVSHTVPATPVIGILIMLQSVFIHSSSRLHFGPLRMLFADNRYHRIHHSVEERHFDRNFGAFTTLWDRLFGTAHFPAPHEWPATGLAEVDTPRTVREWLDLPYRYNRSRAATDDGTAAPHAI